MPISHVHASAKRMQRGIAAVETAIALPLLLFLLICVAELGRAMYQYNTLQKATRDAVRYLADRAICDDTGVVKLTFCGVQPTTTNLTVYGTPNSRPGFELLKNADGSAGTVQVTVSSPDSTHVRVQATYTYVPFLFASIPSLVGGTDITPPTQFTAVATMRAL